MKKIKFFLIAILLCLIPTFNVSAASATISVSANKTRVIVGETVTVTVKVSSSSSLGSWAFDVVPSSNLSLVSSSFGGLNIVDFVSNDSTKSKSYTLKFKAKSSGTGSVTVRNSSVVGYDEISMGVTNGSKSFTLMTQAELEATYSKNNYLKSLSIDGYELSPSFSKDVLEYNVEVPNGTTSVIVNASKEDSTASIKGTGEIEVVEGANKIEVLVTAQNGSTKRYTIAVTVKELDPINVKIGSSDYTVIRKKEQLPSINMYYKEDAIEISGFEVPCYVNENANITLVGLKDTLGNANLYIYQNDSYELYNELVFNQMYIKLLDMDESLLDGEYTKTKIELGSSSVLVYQKEDSEFYLLYGLNLETGEKHLYKYDKMENTIQRYEKVVDNDELYYYIIIGLFGFIILSYIIFIILIAKNNKKAKQIENTMRIDISKISQIAQDEKQIKKKGKKGSLSNSVGEQ